MMRCGSVCVANHIGRLTIAERVGNVLKGFGDDSNTWITVCIAFGSLVASLAAARLRVDGEPGPPVFLSLATSRSRHMKIDTKRC